MTKDEEWELLVRIDERVEALHTWTEKHEGLHKEERQSQRKWLGIFITSIVGIVVRLVFWK